MFKLFLTAALAARAFAYTQPVGASPEGNPIAQPGLNSVVPAGENFTITWEPTTQGTVTLVLLKGPSTNAVPQYAIVEKTANDGVYVWQVASDLQPTDDATGYGIQLIDDATGQYQYTTQFGISNPSYQASSSSSSVSSAPTTTSAAEKTTWTTYCPYETTFTAGSKTYSVTKATTLTITESCSTAPAKTTATFAKVTSASVKAPIGTGASIGFITSKPANVTMVAPTGGFIPTTVATTYSKPLTPSASTTASPTPYKGAASSVATSFFGLAAAAAIALMAM